MASRTLKEGKEYQVHHPGGWSSTQITSYAELFFTFLKRNYMQINKQIIENLQFAHGYQFFQVVKRKIGVRTFQRLFIERNAFHSVEQMQGNNVNRKMKK